MIVVFTALNLGKEYHDLFSKYSVALTSCELINALI
jgi:hypothetical protein